MPFLGRSPDIGAISDNSVTSAKIVNATIVEADLADDAVTSAKIADNQIDIARLNVSDGTNGQLLKTNGSGTLSFTDPPSGGTSRSETFFMGLL
ncbi:MAG: hypothetical protein CML86_06335 [Rhodobiaceae bacterium]|nr:hypothetical protein [Rhodobiaceae bacterium]|tara:strand:- start:1258 stop:1539 length:282 start_codon:yes stop_codon:yes gene_type:complete